MINRMLQRGKPAEQRFWEKVDKNGPIPKHVPEIGQCWVWTAGKNRKGYGFFCPTKRNVGSHRYSWEIYNNQKVPKGLWVLHKCDNPSCVNPNHLWTGTRRDNVDDMVQKGRNAKGERNRSAEVGWKRAGEKNGCAKISFDEVIKIREARSNGIIITELAKSFNISRSQCFRICNGESWGHVKLGLPTDDRPGWT